MLKNMLIAAAFAMMSTGTALADTPPVDEQSYLPPRDLQAKATKTDMQDALQAERRLRRKRYGTIYPHTRRRYAQWQGRRYASRRFFSDFPGIFFALFR
jgi:hypothetical protein